MLIRILKSKNINLRVKSYIYLNNDILRLIMLASTIQVNRMFFMTNHFSYNLSKNPNYWKTKFLKDQLPILSYYFHQRYPVHTYLWLQEYQYVRYALKRTEELWLSNDLQNDYYQSAIIGYLRVGDDLTWLPLAFYEQIKWDVHDYVYHELHFLIYRNVGTVNYQCYDGHDNLITVVTANLKAEESKILLTSMLYHLPHILVKIL